MSVSVIDQGPLSSIFIGLQARLQTAFPANLFHFDIMPARISEKSWARTVKRTPFVGIGWNGATSKGGNNMFTGPAQFSVFLVVQNSSGERGRLLGDLQGPGLFQVVSAAILVLNGFKVPDLSEGALPGATVGTCIAHQVSNAASEWGEENIAVAVLDVEVVGFELSITASLRGAEATPDLLTDIASGWVFSEFAPTVQLNSDGTFGAGS